MTAPHLPISMTDRSGKTAVEIVGAEKILFATDFPLLNAGRYITELDESGLSSSEIECICYRNAQTLLGI